MIQSYDPELSSLLQQQNGEQNITNGAAKGEFPVPAAQIRKMRHPAWCTRSKEFQFIASEQKRNFLSRNNEKQIKANKYDFDNRDDFAIKIRTKISTALPVLSCLLSCLLYGTVKGGGITRILGSHGVCCGRTGNIPLCCIPSNSPFQSKRVDR